MTGNSGKALLSDRDDDQPADNEAKSDSSWTRSGFPARGLVIGVAVLSVLKLIEHAGGSFADPVPVFFLAIVCAAYWGGIASGLLCTGVVLLHLAYSWNSPASAQDFPLEALQYAVPLILTMSPVAILVGTLRNISENSAAAARKAQQSEVDRRQRQLSNDLQIAINAQHNAAESVMILDTNFRVVSVNKAFTNITGYTEADVLGRKPTFLRAATLKDENGVFHVDEEAHRRKWQMVQATGNWNGVTQRSDKHGTIFTERSNITVLRDEAGAVTHYIVVTIDITRDREHEERIAYLAYHDESTGLPNRIRFTEILNEALTYAARCKARLTVMVIELDRIRAVNQSLSHAISETVMKLVVERIRGCMANADILASLRTEQFAVLLHDVDSAKGSEALAQVLREALAAPFAVENQEIFVNAYFGMATYPTDGTHPDLIINNATLAMQEARKRRDTRFVSFSPALETNNAYTLALSNDLHRAVDRGEFVLLYQPKVDAASSRILGAEALIRWNHPTMGMISPVEFIPLAEESGTILAIGDWVLKTACVQTAAWRAAGYGDLKIAVNLSARQLRQGDFAERVRRIVEDSRLPPSCLELEITESLLMDDPLAAAAVLQEIHDAGIGLALDDFGTGYSSLAYLKRFPIDCLKIDRAFIKDLPDDQDDAAITRAIIAMAKSLQLRIVAEGVETLAQQTVLRREGCDELQGYLFGKPLTAQAITLLIAESPLSDTALPA